MLGDKVTVSYSVEPTEKELYEESRRLKFMAREKRKLRIEKEAADARERERRAKEERRRSELLVEQRIQQQKDDDRRYKKELDDRIRKALVDTAEIFKRNGLAFEAPSQYWTDSSLKNSFNIIDTSKSDPARSGARVKINTTYNGFQWD